MGVLTPKFQKGNALTPTKFEELLVDFMDRPLFQPREGDYVEFIDEEDPNSAVQFCRKNGTVFMIMPYADYKAFRSFKR